MSRKFAIEKSQKMVLDAALLNTQHYQLRIKGKVEQSREWSSALSYTLMEKLLKKEPSGHPRLRSPTLRTLHFLVITKQREINRGDKRETK